MGKKTFFRDDVVSRTNFLKDQFKEAQLFDLSNISVPLETDFLELLNSIPVVAPFENMWVEFDELPGLPIPDTRYGALVKQTRGDAGWTLLIYGFQLMAGFGISTFDSVVILTLDKSGRARLLDTVDSPIMDAFDGPIVGLGDRNILLSKQERDAFFNFALQEEGINDADIQTIDDFNRIISSTSLLNNTFIRKFQEDTTKLVYFTITNLTFFSLALLNTKNIEMVDSHTSAKGGKRRNRYKGERHYTLRIRPDSSRSANNEEDHQPTGVKSSFHFARGHFKTYTEDAPLFGKYTGTYWWEAHARGAKSSGEITKDYKVIYPDDQHDKN